MFIDEIYTYGLSNSYYAPFVTDIKGGDMRDTVMTRQELVDYLFVGEDAVRIFHLADARSNYMYNIFGIS